MQFRALIAGLVLTLFPFTGGDAVGATLEEEGSCVGDFVQVPKPCPNCTAIVVPSISPAPCDGSCAWSIAAMITCVYEGYSTIHNFTDSGVLGCNNEHRVRIPCSSGAGVVEVVGFTCTPEGC